MTDLSPSAQAVLDAFLKALMGPMALECQRIRKELLAIAAELETSAIENR